MSRSLRNDDSAPLSETELHSRRIFRNELNGLDAWSRHKRFVESHLNVYGRSNDLENRRKERASGYKTEFDILKENHRFLRSPADDDKELTWEQRVAKKYYDQLFKEYCIAELKHFKEGKIALRWRTQSEAISGKGQFFCGSLRCSERDHLTSWEVNFAYTEQGEKKNALVKLRLCPRCSEFLHYGKGTPVQKAKKRSRDGRERNLEVVEDGADDEKRKRKNRKKRRERSEDDGEGRRPSRDVSVIEESSSAIEPKHRGNLEEERPPRDPDRGRRKEKQQIKDSGPQKTTLSSGQDDRPPEQGRTQEQIEADVDRFFADLFQ